jgi:hypothetical protein
MKIRIEIQNKFYKIEIKKKKFNKKTQKNKTIKRSTCRPDLPSLSITIHFVF